MAQPTPATDVPSGAVSTSSSEFTERDIPFPLVQAIKSCDLITLQLVLFQICKTSKTFIEELADELLISDAEVVPYHADTEEEDNLDEEEEDSDEDADKDEMDDDREDEDGESESSDSLQLEDMKPRYAVCENCNEQFDLSWNEKRECSWHRGKKIPRPSAFWDKEYDPAIHGTKEQMMKSPEYRGSRLFRYDCCPGPIFSDCKRTRHRSVENILNGAPGETSLSVVMRERKEEKVEGFLYMYVKHVREAVDEGKTFREVLKYTPHFPEH